VEVEGQLTEGLTISLGLLVQKKETAVLKQVEMKTATLVKE
jgi:hypothetical protein